MKVISILGNRWFARSILATVVLGLILVRQTPTPLASAADNSDLQSFMRKKLDASSKILEGLTVEDTDLIRKGAAALLEMSKAEQWNVLLDEDYREYNREFRSLIRKLDKAAESNNFDNALLQWLDATKACIDCHQHVRDQRPVVKK
jgi:hypothetical protein